MKKTPQKLLLILSMAIPVLLPATSGEFTRVRRPSNIQKCVLQGLERDIADIERDIEEYYVDLLDDPCKAEEGGDPSSLNCNIFRINKGDETTIVPLTSEKQTYYARRKTYFYYEMGFIKWNGKKVESFRFNLKRSLIGAGIATIKTLSRESIKENQTPGSLDVKDCLKQKIENNKGQNAPLSLLIREVLQSGRGSVYTFRVPTEKELTIKTENKLVGGKRMDVQVAYIRDKAEEIEVDGVMERVHVAFIREPRQQITITREYLRLLKLLKRRLDWNSRRVYIKQAAEIERAFKNR